MTGLLFIGLGLRLADLLCGIQYAGQEKAIHALLSLGFGGSLISVFARVGGGIYTKAADVGADLVGKVEAGIPEDDPRNPAVIADNVGDNVGDCAGMAADLFETYAVTTVAAMVLAFTLFKGQRRFCIPLPWAALRSLPRSRYIVRSGRPGGRLWALYKGLFWAGGMAAAAFYPGDHDHGWCGRGERGELLYRRLDRAGGHACSRLYYRLLHVQEFRPVKAIAKASETGHATNIIAGLAVGMQATAWPVIVIGGGHPFEFTATGGAASGGFYGVAVAAVSMLSMAGIVVAIDAFGPITDNAGGIAEMAHLGKEVRDITDPLDAVGNTTKAVTKGYAIGSAGLAAVVLFAEYAREAAKGSGASTFDLSNPSCPGRTLLGRDAALHLWGPLYESGGRGSRPRGRRGAQAVPDIKGIMEGTGKPEYGTCVDIVTQAAIKKMMVPGLIPVISPILVGIIPGRRRLGDARRQYRHRTVRRHLDDKRRRRLG